MVPLLRAEGGKEEAQVCYGSEEDDRPPKTEAMACPLPPSY